MGQNSNEVGTCRDCDWADCNGDEWYCTVGLEWKAVDPDQDPCGDYVRTEG